MQNTSNPEIFPLLHWAPCDNNYLSWTFLLKVMRKILDRCTINMFTVHSKDTRTQDYTQWTHDLNRTYGRRSYDIQDVIWLSNLRFIWVTCPLGKGLLNVFITLTKPHVQKVFGCEHFSMETNISLLLYLLFIGSHQRYSVKKVSQKFRNIHRKTSGLKSHFIKVSDLQLY